MGSLKITSDPSGAIMSLFKATLWLSVLTFSNVHHVGAAPVELVAGRVLSHEPLTQNLGFVGDINSLRSLFANGIPAGISLVRTVPQVSHVSHAVPTVNAVSTVPVAKTILHTPSASSVVHRHQQHHPVTHVAAVPAVESVRLANTHVVHTPLATPAVIPARNLVPVPTVAPSVLPARASVLPAAPPAIVPAVSQRIIPEEELVPANYNFGYSVSDVVSGDSKTRQETREGDVVTGSYSVADPDGRIRTVTYTADSVHGFQAKVTYDGEEGPVAIPFNPPPAPVNVVANAPAPINVVASAPSPAPFPAPISSPAPEATPDSEEVIIAKDAPTPASPTTLTTSAPVTTPVNPPQPIPFVPRALPAVPAVPVTPASTIRTAPRLLNAFPQVNLNQLLRVLNHNDNVHALHNLPGGVTTVRTGAGAPVDLSQFTFLSGGQVLV